MDVRIIPCLQLHDGRLVKTKKFSQPQYIGDPVNTVRIFNELEADELCLLDIRATIEKKEPYYILLEQIAGECFMPLSYGGGINSFEAAKKIFRCGFEKIILNSAALSQPQLIQKLSGHFGSQAIIVSIDVKKNLLGQYKIMSHSGTIKMSKDVSAWAQEIESLGAGEILLTSINREGSWEGFDTELVKKIADSVSIPLIAHGGAGNEEHIRQLILSTGINAVAIGSMFVFQKKDMGVLVNLPMEKIRSACSEHQTK